MKHLNLILIDKDIRLLTMRDGLTDNTIPCIYKDEDGFMWFGTDDGLSRYDGKRFRISSLRIRMLRLLPLCDCQMTF